jgi:AcrR family transcriptional regulator
MTRAASRVGSVDRMPARAHQLPQTRVSRDDWVRAALTALTTEGIGRVKVAVLADALGVARSSFYWYFGGRDDLEVALLAEWEARNIAPIIERAERPAATVTAAVLGLFECWADPSLFDHRLEFAIREWARRDDSVRQRVELSDELRISAIAALHRRYGDDVTTAMVRARVQYHSQIGMYALGIDEPMSVRLRMVSHYVRIFTGVDASADELAAFTKWVRRRAR